MRSHILRKLHWIPRLHEHRAGTRELADQTFARTHIANDSSTCDPLQDIRAIPGDEVSVIDDVLFAFSELFQQR